MEFVVSALMGLSAQGAILYLGLRLLAQTGKQFRQKGIAYADARFLGSHLIATAVPPIATIS
jgi:hypothetical protein